MKNRFIDVIRAVKRDSISEDEAVCELCILFDVSGSFLHNYFYHQENEQSNDKTFRNVVTNKWYYENELCDVIGIDNIESIKSK